MKIVLGSIFRDSESYLDGYLNQVRTLADACKLQGNSFRVVWVEGDSVDQTYVRLFESLNGDLNGRLLKRDHHGPKYGSVDLVERWRQTAPVCNTVLENIPEDTDVVIYVESDLIWTSQAMHRLMADLVLGDVDAIGAMIWLRGGVFYDTYAYRSGGKHFENVPPYHPCLLDHPTLVQMDSIGSCIVMRGEVARACRFGLDTCLIGESLIEHGYKLWLDPNVGIWHP